MNGLSHLIVDLKKLNKDYLELSEKPINLQTKEDAEEKEKNTLRAGQLLIDFYNKVFTPQYSRSSEIPQGTLDNVEQYLSYLSSTASRLIKEKVYFGLSVLLINRGSHIGDPNNLEKLIQDLKKKKK